MSQGGVWFGKEGQDKAKRGAVWLSKVRYSKAGYGMVRLGWASRGMAWHGLAGFIFHHVISMYTSYFLLIS